MTSPAEIALSREILRGVVGSTAHGTAVDGQDDRDEMAVFVEPPAQVCGLSPLAHYIYRDKPEGVRSGPGDLDLTMYSLRRFCGLAAQGNATVMLLFWLPDYLTRTDLGNALVAIRDVFVSREAGRRFLGYLRGQKDRLAGSRAANVARPELVARYGYDTKYAMHALRLGYEGIELMSERRLTLPVPEPQLSTLRAVRAGELDRAEALSLIEDAERRLLDLVERCTWEADREAIDRFLVEAHLADWRRRGELPA
jgi:hypothetical protein